MVEVDCPVYSDGIEQLAAELEAEVRVPVEYTKLVASSTEAMSQSEDERS